MELNKCCLQNQRDSSNNDININRCFDIGSPPDSNFDFTADEDINEAPFLSHSNNNGDVIDSYRQFQNSPEKVFVIHQQNNHQQIVDTSPIVQLCSDNDLIQMLESSPAQERGKESSPNMQSSNTTESNFKLAATNSKTDAENAQHVLEQQRFLDDLFLPFESDVNGDFNDLKAVPQMEDIEKILMNGFISPKAADLIPQNPNLSTAQINQDQGQSFFAQQYQQSSSLQQKQQQYQQQQMAPLELVPVADQEPACKKQKQSNHLNLPPYQNLKEVRGALKSTLHALDANSRHNQEFDQNYFRRSSSYPFQNHNLNPGLVFNRPIQSSNFNENMSININNSTSNNSSNRSLHNRVYMEQSPFRQFIPTPNYGQVQNPPHTMQNQQLFNKMDYINGIPYMHDADGRQFFVDPQTGRRMSPGPAYFKRQREEHGPNLQNIFQRFGGRQIGGYSLHCRQPQMPPRHSSYSLLESRQFDDYMGGKGNGLVKEGVLDQIRGSAQASQWRKMEQNIHLQRALQQQQKQQMHQQKNGQEAEITARQPATSRPGVGVSIAQKVVSEATERGLDGQRSSGFTIESQFQRQQQLSGRVEQFQGVSRDPWSVHFDAQVKDQTGQQHFLGGYTTQGEAARAHDVGQLYFNPESSATNFPVTDYSSVDQLRQLGPSEYVLEMQRYASNVGVSDSKFLGVRKGGADGSSFEACFTDVEVPIYPPVQRASVSPPFAPDHNNSIPPLPNIKQEPGI